MKFTVKTSGFDKIARKIDQAGGKAAHAVAVQIAKDTEPFVPALTKSLVNRTQVDGNTVIYPGPYARYLYHGKLMVDSKTGSAWTPMGASKMVTRKELNFNRSVHKLAQSHWFPASKAVNKDKWVRVAGKAMEQELK